MLRSLRQHPIGILIFILILAAIIWGFWPQPVLVETVDARLAPLTVTIEEEGKSRVIDRYVISAPVAGVACRVELDVGDRVNKDQELLAITALESQVLDPRSRARAEARIAAANSALLSAQQNAAAAKADADFRKVEVERLRVLAERRAISREDLDRAEMQVSAAVATERATRHSVDVAKYELDAAKTALQYLAGTLRGEPSEKVSVRSPIDGAILKVQHECAGPVTTGEALLEIGDTSQLEIEVDVLSTDAIKIEPGTSVFFDRWGGEESLQGIVRTVEPAGFTKISALGVEEQRVLVIADIISPAEQWQKLGDGYRVDARFIIWQENSVLQAPSSSLFRVNDSWALFIVENGRAVQRIVTVGQRNGLAAQITDNLKIGDAIIIHPNDNIEHGTRVKNRL